MGTRLIVAVDCEGTPERPYSLQWSTQAGTGFLIKATDIAGLQYFEQWLRRSRPTIAFHNSLYDIAVLRSMNIDIIGMGLPFVDSMVASYLLQLTPQGLKPLSARYLSMQMESYTDLMGDTENQIARDYLMWLWDAEQEDYETAQQKEFEIQRAFGRRIKVLPDLPKSALQKAAGRVLQSKRPKKLWDDQVLDVQVAAYARLGTLPDATLDYLPAATVVHYGCRDADATWRIQPELRHQIESLGLESTYNLELGTYPLIDRMQQIGIRPDLAHFARLSDQLGREVVRLQGVLASSTGLSTFNANSGDQVADYLFGTVGLEEVKWTKGGRGSTNDKILEALEHEHPEYPVISCIRTYRETYKLKYTFVDRLPDFVDRWPHDGRVHANFRTTRVVTGRLAASDPNLLAQPEHGQFAPDFKRGWVAAEGHVLAAWDESQVELRGLAHLSQDPVLLAVYRGERRNRDGSPVDIHAATAERIFGVPPHRQDKSKHRLPAKAVNFGIPMGITKHGLSIQLRKSGVDADEETAQRWIDETLGLYRGVARYMEERKAEARRAGYVRCLSGRIRYIGGIRSRDDRVREEAERFAFSTPIQESATFIMKQAERIVYEDILVPWWKRGRWVEPLVQIHDCLKMEVAEGLERELHLQMVQAMTQVPHGFSVPLAVEGEFGPNMSEMQRFDNALEV